MLPTVLLGVVLSIFVLCGETQNYVPVDTLLLGFMDSLRYNITHSLIEPTEEARRFMDDQKDVMDRILRKLDSLEQEITKVQECCLKGQEHLHWSRRLCSRAARTCPPGWHTFNGSCYYISNTSGTWNEGLDYCTSIGANYININSFAEWDFTLGLIKEATWLGLNDLEEEGTFRWIADEKLPEYFKWRTGEPNDRYGEDCVVSDPYYDHQWNDDDCTERYRFACELNLEDMYS